MAVVVAQLAAPVDDSVNGTTITSNSATPGANELNIITVQVRNQDADADPGTPSISGRNLTWTTGPNVLIGTRRRMTTFYGIGASPSTGAVVCTYGVNVRGKIIDDIATGNDTSDPVIDTNNDTATGTGTAVSGLAFPNAFGAAGNAAYMVAFHVANEGTTHDSGGGFTEVTDSFAAQGGMMSQYQVADADGAASWATSADYGALCVEIKAAAAGVTATIVSSLDEITAALNAYMASSPNIVSAVDEITAALAVNQSQLVTVGSELDEIICSLNVNQSYPVTIVSSLDEITAALNAYMASSPNIVAALDEATADLSVNQSYPVTIVSELDEAESSLNAYMASSPNIVATEDEIAADLSVNQSILTTIVSVLDEMDSSLNVYEAAGPNITSALDEAESSLSVNQSYPVTLEAVLDEIIATLNIEVTDAGVVIPPQQETRYPESGGVLLIPRRPPELVIITPIHPAPSKAVVFGRLNLTEPSIGGRSFSVLVSASRLREAREIEIPLGRALSRASLAGSAASLHVLDPYVEKMLRAEIEAEMLIILG